MKMGVREFREKLSEVANGDDFVVVTNNGQEIGTYMPKKWMRDVGAARKAAESLARWQAEMRARGIDLDKEMAAMGLTPFGELLAEG